MAGPEELLYRPDIKQPKRETTLPTPSEAVEIIRTQDIPNQLLVAYYNRMEELNLTARELSNRARFLIDIILEDMDGYVGDAPGIILQYLHDLTGIDFEDDNGLALATTDPIFTLPPETIKCIFRVANYYNDKTYDPELLDAIQNWDSSRFNDRVMKQAKKMGYMDSIVYGLKLLVMVAKICYVIMVHYTIGYQCATFSKFLNISLIYGISINKRLKIKLKKWHIGKAIAKVFGKLEDKLLRIVGFRCKEKHNDPSCKTQKWDKLQFRTISCCTTSPFFFTPSSAGQPLFSLSRCFEQWINEELDINPRQICDITNRDNTEIDPTNVEIAKATAIVKYMVENGSKSGSMARSDLNTVRSAKAAADQGIMMTDSIKSSLSSMRTYEREDQSGPWWNCFGFSPEDNSTGNQKYNILINQTTPGSTLIETGAYFQEYMAKIDEALVELLKYADKIVIGTANLAKWGSSKQLCCYIYLLVVLASLYHSLVVKGNICEGLDSETDSGDGFTNAIRNELRWATNLQGNENIEKFTALLNLIKQIIDIFIRKMERALFLQGLVLPFGEMFEMIKLTLIDGLSSFMDILFAPLDMLLVNVQAIPEIRHMINNQCFGFDKLLDFLSCSIGSLKFGILAEVDDLINKLRVKDVVLVDDIYLSRTRLEFLRALSRLLGIMIELIFHLRDCYDPRDMINGILEKQQQDMYNGVKDMASLLNTPERIAYMDRVSESMFGQNFVPDAERIAELEGDPSRLSAAFGEIGIIGDTIIQSDLFCTNCEKKVFKISDFVDNDGNILPPAEFIKRAEDFSDMKIADLHTNMTEIFNILRGSSNA